MQALDAGLDLALTPDQSGGYAMIGMSTPQSLLFDLPMSTDDMLSRTLQVAHSLDLGVSTTRAGFDIDVVGDFHCFGSLSRSRLLDLCPRTVESISSLPEIAVL